MKSLGDEVEVLSWMIERVEEDWGIFYTSLSTLFEGAVLTASPEKKAKNLFCSFLQST